ncbi:MAG: hypothetical protein ACOH2A_03395 [Sphingobacteriaceae bacterium]
MKTLITALSLCFMMFQAMAQPAPSAEMQIKTALLAAPADKRDGASVYGYNSKGEFVMIRKGTNEMVCLSDDPNKEGLSVSCYHRDLEPFMKRGRELKMEGKNPKEILTIREQEVKSGKLHMPEHPTTLYVYSADAKNYDATTAEVKNGYLRYVIYIPYATSESTGLPLQADGPGVPWLMDPGTHRAHIMINP